MNLAIDSLKKSINDDIAENIFAGDDDEKNKAPRRRLTAAGVDAGTIGYVEAHGTATALGDPVEVAALTHAFRASTQDSGFCALGSVKSNLGHLDAAAGKFRKDVVPRGLRGVDRAGQPARERNVQHVGAGTQQRTPHFFVIRSRHLTGRRL